MDLGDSSQQGFLTRILSMPLNILVLLWSKPYLGLVVFTAMLMGCMTVYFFKQCWVRYVKNKEFVAKKDTILAKARKERQRESGKVD